MSVCPEQYVCKLYNITFQWSAILAENRHYNDLLQHHLSMNFYTTLCRVYSRVFLSKVKV